MSRYTHILFDHDGVLVNTEPLYFRATQECVADLGVDLRLGDYLAMMAEGKNAWELARRSGANESAIDQARYRRNSRYRELLNSEPIDIEGVDEVLAELSRCYRIAIVTTALREDFELIHRGRDIVSNVDFVLTRDAYSNSKPHPDPYLAALDRFRISPEVALAVEDSQRGLTAAIAAGLDCVVVHNEFTTTQDLSQATYHIDHLKDLLPHVLRQR
ncbi:MAG: HAD family phosphatase [Gammaproteobacteria bacterium]|nr:HAD family phosphatase [Gammaproteobacteria bacterium]